MLLFACVGIFRWVFCGIGYSSVGGGGTPGCGIWDFGSACRLTGTYGKISRAPCPTCSDFVVSSVSYRIYHSLCSAQNADLLVEGRGAFPEVQLTTVSQLHEVLLSEITVAGMDDPPAEVRALFESFLRQLSLPRLVHFFDLVLAQMIPRWETSAGQARSRLVCHVLRLWNDAWHRGVQRPNICFSFRRQFVSRAGIEHIAVHWQHNEVLLFTDPEHVELLDTNEFRSATALEHHRKNVQLGLRIGQAALIEFELHGQFMKAIWILMNNKLPSQKGGSDPLNRNPFWKVCGPHCLVLCLVAGESGTCVLRRVAGHFPDKIICGPSAVSG